MEGCFPSFRSCLEIVQGPSFSVTQSYAHLSESDSLKLDNLNAGANAVVQFQSYGSRIFGNGGALGNSPIMQDKAYFEIIIQQGGTWGVGLATKFANLSSAPIIDHAYVLKNDGSVVADGEIIDQIELVDLIGKPIGIAFDYNNSELKFILPEGPVIRNITLPVRQTCGSHQLFPLAYVANGAIIDVKFAEFDGPLPLGFEPILIERAII